MMDKCNFLASFVTPCRLPYSVLFRAGDAKAALVTLPFYLCNNAVAGITDLSQVSADESEADKLILTVNSKIDINKYLSNG